jgi:hypothetical protein
MTSTDPPRHPDVLPPWVQVNHEGRRFVDELQRRDHVTMRVMEACVPLPTTERSVNENVESAGQLW